jgi:hypothetical protein
MGCVPIIIIKILAILPNLHLIKFSSAIHNTQFDFFLR